MWAFAGGGSGKSRSQLGGCATRGFDSFIRRVAMLPRTVHAIADLLEAPLGVERAAFRNLDPMLQGGEGLQSFTGQPGTFFCR